MGELKLPTRASIIVILVIGDDGRTTVSPTSDRVLAESDTLLLVTQGSGLEQLAALA